MTSARFLLIAIICLGLTSPAFASDVYTKPDDSWITVTGKVSAVTNEAFTLDYGEGLVTVEMDDWDWYDEANLMREGEKVMVSGRIDDDLFEMRTIEAGSVYVYDRNTYFYANDADEEGAYVYPMVTLVPDHTAVTLTGTIKKIDGREFVLDTGITEFRIDTINMPYNPLDNSGYQKLDEGDRVSIMGNLDVDFFESTEIQASSIVTLTRDTAKKSRS